MYAVSLSLYVDIINVLHMPSICVFTGWPRVNNEELGGSSIMCKEVDMSAAVQEVKEGKLKLRVAARA